MIFMQMGVLIEMRLSEFVVEETMSFYDFYR